MFEFLLLPLFALLDVAAGGKFEKGRGGPLNDLFASCVFGDTCDPDGQG